ncbi:hypothetical protein SCUP234_04534 [Seiridium cupressi]
MGTTKDRLQVIIGGAGVGMRKASDRPVGLSAHASVGSTSDSWSSRRQGSDESDQELEHKLAQRSVGRWV